ncbi:MAG: PolC-type DNA polymerase III, partial [Merdibacter sp.]
IQHFVQREASARIFAEVMPLIHEDVILYQVPETSQRDALAARLPLLKAFLETVGILNEIRIELKDKEEQIPAVKCANAPVRQTPPPAASNPPANPYRRRKVSTKDYVSVDIRDLQDGMSNVKIRGHIFQSEITTFKNGKCLQTLYISDDDDAIIMKRFERGALTKEALAEIKEGDHVEAYGQAVMDSYLSDLVFMPTHIEKVEPTVRRDPAKEKRIELHVHSNFSEMDGVCDIAQFIRTADEWGMDAIACTDHMVVQAFPKAQSTLASINKKRETPMKVLYGVEMNMVDPDLQIVYQPDDTVLEEGTYLFDLETTGLSARYDHIIEFGGVIVENRACVKSLQLFIRPPHALSAFTTNLTGITDMDVQDAPTFEECVDQILDFIGDHILVAHNASFDFSFLNSALRRIGRKPLDNPVIDTLDLARSLQTERKSYTLGAIARSYGIAYDQEVAHRADYDADVLAQTFLHMLNELRDITTLNELQACQNPEGFKKVRTKHVVVLARNQTGLKELFELITLSHTTYLAYNGKTALSGVAEPRIPRIEIEKRRMNGNLLIGSACANGEVFEMAQTRDVDDLRKVMRFYDYIELQPLANYQYLIDRDQVIDQERLKEILRGIIDMADELGKPIVATSDAHYVHPNQKRIRDIYINSQAIGGVRHPLYLYNQEKRHKSHAPDQHLRTTQEMLDAFSWVGDRAYEFVVTNTHRIADQIETIYPIKDKLYPPDIEGSDQKLRDICYENAYKKYGDPLPEIVEQRLKRELDAIIGAGYYVVYYISHLLVKKSLDDGYLVGSRGSVGSSFVATMAEITEVNPLAPHYVCPNCKYSHFYTDGSVLNGFDLPDKTCPKCGAIMRGDGQDIPFETFLGFEGDKVPDIDLNFSGDYQPRAHAYTKEVFGDEHVFRAGTVGTVQTQTAFGYIKGYEEAMGIEGSMRNPKRVDLAKLCEGVKRTTGQHPGGIVVVPLDMDVHDFTPVQYPANNPFADWKTTHFDFHQIHDNILKFDILGHVDPTAMKMLERMSGIDVRTIPMNDPQTMSIFSSVDALNIDTSKNTEQTGAAGLPEFGTPFVRGILELTRPTTFDELLKISGLSHGTDVWLGNAKDLIDNGICTLKSVIGCRDDIIVYLLHKGMKPKLAFTIMESVRKGKGLKEEWIVEMKANGVEDWYIESCKKIKYMFPKAHAVAYVMMAIRIAWFKVHMPMIYYCMFFSIRCDAYDIETMIKGEASIRQRMAQIQELSRSSDRNIKPSKKDLDTFSTLELALEMVLRGYHFSNIDINRSSATEFIVDTENRNAIIPPFTSIDGLGESVADSIVKAREEAPFLSKEDLLKRSSLSVSLMKKLDALGALEGLQEENQLSLF